MKITRRDFLKTTALTSLYFAGFGGTTYGNAGTKKNLVQSKDPKSLTKEQKNKSTKKEQPKSKS